MEEVRSTQQEDRGQEDSVKPKVISTALALPKHTLYLLRTRRRLGALARDHV